MNFTAILRRRMLQVVAVPPLLLAAAADLSAATAAPTNITWLGDASESTRPSGVSFLVETNGSVTVAFATQSSPPSYMIASVGVDMAASDPGFSGDYLSNGVKGVSFTLISDGCAPVNTTVFFGSKRSGRVWYNPNVQASDVAGQVVLNSILFERASGWATDAKGDLDVMWREDLGCVDVIGVRMMQKGRAPQACMVSGFRLYDANGFVTSSAVLGKLEQALYMSFGVTSADALSDAQKLRDANGNGMADFTEILLENDLNYANSVFAAEVMEIEGDIITIKWPCVNGSTYSVYRATDLNGGFFLLPGAASLQATQTGYMTYKDTATGSSTYYYKVKRLLPQP